ncbi:MAG TPA: universal stress protein [Chloroflexia bacterium]|nr:universal stress protein [Chloroflexia bacterium]
MLTKILVPFDGSLVAARILPYALKLAQVTRGELVLLRVIPTLERDRDSHAQQQEHQAHHYLESLKALLTAVTQAGALAGESVQVAVVHGHPARAIADAAVKAGASLILMSTHGRSGLSQLVLGSTALEVVQQTALPVMLVRPNPSAEKEVELSALLREKPVSLEGPMVLTLDGSPEAEVALKPALDLAEAADLPLHLLRVLHPFIPADELAPWYADHLDIPPEKLHQEAFSYIRSQADRYLQAVKFPEAAKIRADQRVLREGEPANEIIKYAQEVKAAVVVMATHAPNRFEQAVLGSVADRVLCHGRLPVIMVHISPRQKEL